MLAVPNPLLFPPMLKKCLQKDLFHNLPTDQAQQSPLNTHLICLSLSFQADVLRETLLNPQWFHLHLSFGLPNSKPAHLCAPAG